MKNKLAGCLTWEKKEIILEQASWKRVRRQEEVINNLILLMVENQQTAEPLYLWDMEAGNDVHQDPRASARMTRTTLELSVILPKEPLGQTT